jgi:hypothetical protein
MVLNHVEPALRKIFNPDPTPPRWQRQGVEEPTRAAVLGFGALARLARSHVLGHVDVLTDPKGEATHRRPHLGAPEVSPERAVVALAENLRAQPAAGGDAEAVHRTLPVAVE